MDLATSEIPVVYDPKDRLERLDLARSLFQRFHATCFWHSPRTLEITDDLIPFVAKGLRTNGGRIGYILAGKIQPNAPGREDLGCR